MNRLTHPMEEGGYYIECSKEDAVNKLAFYENSGIEPNDLVQHFTIQSCLNLVGSYYGISGGDVRTAIRLFKANLERNGQCNER